MNSDACFERDQTIIVIIIIIISITVAVCQQRSLDAGRHSSSSGNIVCILACVSPSATYIIPKAVSTTYFQGGCCPAFDRPPSNR